jgi:hypothetical protein
MNDLTGGGQPSAPNVYQAFMEALNQSGRKPVLRWDKPAKKLSVADWKDDYGFDGGPTGGYQPNMSQADAETWRAVLTGTKRGYPQVEIRKSLRNAVMILIIVNLGEGYYYKHLQPMSEYEGKTPADYPRLTQQEINHYAQRDNRPTRGINVHLSMNGGAQLTFDQMEEMNQAVAEAKAFLESLPSA